MRRAVLAVVVSGLIFDAAALRAQVQCAIRVYQHGMYKPGLVIELQRAVARILAGSDLELTLLDCHREATCEHERGSDELVLRLMSGRHHRGRNVCGMAHPGADGQPGVLMTVFIACIKDITHEMHGLAARRDAKYALMRLNELDVLAPIVVHETLHLLLPDEGHGFGILKSALDQGDLERALNGKLKLRSDLAERARAAVVARSARTLDR